MKKKDAKGGEIQVVNKFNDMNLPKDIYSNGKIYKGKAIFINGYNGYTSTKDDGYLIDEKGNYLTDKKGNNLVAKERRGVVIDLSKYAKGGKTPKYNYSIPFLKFYQEFFEEDGEEFTLQEVNDKLIEDEIQEYDIKAKDDEDMIEIFPLDKNGDNIKLF